MKRIFPLVAAAIAVAACSQPVLPVETMDSITVDMSAKGAGVSARMYGIFIDESGYSCDGGLIAELIENNSFEAPGIPGWTLKGAAKMSLDNKNPMFESAPNSLAVKVNGNAVLANDGFWGMGLQQGKNYELRTIVKPCAGSSITARLVADNGDVLAETPVSATKDREWNDVSFILTPNATADKGSFELAIEAKGTVSFDYVSLLPEDRYEYEGGKLPFRKDVVQMLVDLKPAFVRWPGGCVVSGLTLDKRFEWKKSLGDPASRPVFEDLWGGYYSSYTFGYHEWLCFCESMGAAAMYVCNAGMDSQGVVCDRKDIDLYIDDCLDAIEYAIGPTDSEWGALRAKAGHPEPFPLKYVEVGNENSGKPYEMRYDRIHQAIKDRYPEITVICNNELHGVGSIEETDMIDPHWYVKPEFFFRNTELFDRADRGEYAAYVGEYAVNQEVGSGNMLAALAEAAWISGMERNGDFVRMCSYAPLIENAGDRCWPVNLISVNSSQVFGRSSYYVQKMVAENRPDYNVKCSAYKSEELPERFLEGKISLGTNDTASEFKDLKVTTADGKEHKIDLSKFDAKQGSWKYSKGVLSQSTLDDATLCTFDGKYEGNYSIDFKFRRTSGVEGCYVGFAMSDDAMNGYRCSIGGWDDMITAIEHVIGNAAFSVCSEKKCCVVREGQWQDVHVDVADSLSVLYVDGKQITEHMATSMAVAYYSAGYDAANSEAVLKIVNRGGEPFPLGVTLEGLRKVARSGKVITLAAASETDENTFENPTRISPVESGWDGFGKIFVYTLEPYSYTVLRVKVR